MCEYVISPSMKQKPTIDCVFNVHLENTLRFTFFYGSDVATLLHPNSLIIYSEQTRTNMSQPGRRPVTAIGNERHVLQTLWSRKDI